MTTDGFDDRFEELAAIAYRAAYRILGDREESRDIAQEALARAYSRWGRVADHAAPWVARVAGNQALSVTRRQATRRRHRPPPPGAVDPTDLVGERRRLADALASLPRRQRDTVLLRYVADLPEPEVARLLGCSVGTVKSQTHRALHRLRPLLADDTGRLTYEPREPLMFDHLDDPVPFLADAPLRSGVLRRSRELRRRRHLAVALSTLAVAILVVGAGVLAWRDGVIDPVERIDVAATGPGRAGDGAPGGDPDGEPVAPDQPTLFLVVGLDGVDDGRRADTILLARADPVTGGLSLLSLPRDLAVDGGGTRLSATAVGGADGLTAAVEGVTGLDVDHYVELEPEGFAALVDRAGGLDLQVTEAVRDTSSGLDLQPSACRHLDGLQALALARSRHLEVREGDRWVDTGGSDLARVGRQQLILQAAVAGLADADAGDVPGLVEAVVEHAAVDRGLSTGELVGWGRWLLSRAGGDVASHPVPLEPATRPDGSQVLVSGDGWEEAMAAFEGGDQPPPTDASLVAGGAPVDQLLAPC